MKIAVTGGTGRIGGRVVQLLADTGQHDVVALSSRSAPWPSSKTHSCVVCSFTTSSFQPRPFAFFSKGT